MKHSDTLLGDELAVMHARRFEPDAILRKITVARLTPTQIVGSDGNRYLRRNGDAVGVSSLRAERWTPAHDAELRRSAAQSDLRTAAYRLDREARTALALGRVEEAERLIAAISAFLPPPPTKAEAIASSRAAVAEAEALLSEAGHPEAE